MNKKGEIGFSWFVNKGKFKYFDNNSQVDHKITTDNRILNEVLGDCKKRK